MLGQSSVPIFSLWPWFPTPSSQDLCNFPSDKSIWHRVPKSHEMSWVIGMSLVLMRWLIVGSSHQKDQAMLRSLELLLTLPPILWRREGAGNEVNNQSCLCDEAPIVWASESFNISEHTYIPGGAAPQLKGDRSFCIQDLSRSCCMYLFIWHLIWILYHILYYNI